MASVQPSLLGAILAGGASRRFGDTKALAAFGAEPMVRHVARVAVAALDEVVVVTSDPRIAAAAELRALPDRVPGGGPLAGLDAALAWAAARGGEGVLALACDTPLLPAALLRAVAEAGGRSGAPALAAEGPGGPEPLCAWYGVELAAEVARRLERGERSLHRLLADAGAATLPIGEVARFADPAVCFLNLNTRDELADAQRDHGGS